MLISFEVSNFRSFRDATELSLLASKDKDFAETNATSTGVKSAERLLRTAAIWGANGSGKSNLVLALSTMRNMVRDSAVKYKPDQQLPYVPFALSPKPQPSTFSLFFLLDGKRHHYGFSYDADRIVEEWLHVYVSAKPQQWFLRKFNTSSERYEFKTSDQLKGPKETWQAATRPNALFLSTCAQLNSEQLLNVYQWISSGIAFLEARGGMPFEATAKMFSDPEDKSLITSLMCAADFGISGIEISKSKHKVHNITFEADGNVTTALVESDVQTPLFTHTDGDGRIFKLPFENESTGTQQFFMIAGQIVEALRNARVLIVDELGSSWHTLLTRRIIELFQKGSSFMSSAQLICTTHDIALLDSYGLFRRDQIWFARKNAAQSSELIPLSTFHPRKGEALARGYLGGRYDGIGIFQDALFESVVGKVTADAGMLNLSEQHEVDYWAAVFDTSPEKLRTIAEEVGPSLSRIFAALRTGKTH